MVQLAGISWSNTYCSKQGIIIVLTENEILQFFSSISATAEKIKELFTPTWNGIAASVRCVSSAPVGSSARVYY